MIAFDRFGVPASRADVVVHNSRGEVFARAKLADDGTGEVIEDSELDGYTDFLNAAPGAVAGTVHREAVVFLRAEID